MAKDKNIEEQKDPQQGGLDGVSGEPESGKMPAGGRLQWIIIAAVPVICAGFGFGLGRLLGHSAATDAADSTGQAPPTQAQLVKADGAEKDSQKGWYFDLEPVVANLNEPGATRYVRVALTLEISNELDQKKTTAFLQENAPLLKNLLTIYLASQTIEDMRGDRNLRRIQLEILDNFNEKFFPNGAPQIKQVLLKEFAIQ
jgi:flagellar basal body-associated protein FliL